MKRLLQWLGLWPKETPQREQRFDLERLKTFADNPPGNPYPPIQKRRAANNGVYFGSADAARPTWGNDDPLLSDVIVTNEHDAFTGPKRTTHFLDEIGLVPTFENFGGIADNFQGSGSSFQGSEDSFQGFGGGDTDGAGAGGSWDDGGSSGDSGGDSGSGE